MNSSTNHSTTFSFNAPPVNSRVSVADASVHFGRIVSGIAAALLSKYDSDSEDDADGADEAAKSVLHEVFAGDNTKETH